ncbi:exotoxin [Yersinia enterocolitica]|uniref:exotoxin n=1 Tax=Yersinia enterocolitica TaxID=630 RepID=UPI002AC4ECF6|nr:exotoxin [Yersinia enterocolitica]HEN3351247.1 exotoxin [Yersinia enterocolitica]
MSGKLTTALIAVMAALLVGVVYYHGQSVTKDAAITTVTGERDEARFILSNQVRMVNIINDIAKANENDKQKIAQAGEARVVYIRETIKGDDCTNKPVPAAAADLLRKHANQIRSGATGTDTNKLTF